MPANTAPIFPSSPKTWFIGAVATANTTTDLTTGTIYLLGTAGANGSFLEALYAQPLGTNTASVLRLWINNGGTTGTATNNNQVLDLALPGTTVSQIASAPAVFIEVRRAIQANYRVYLTIGTTVAAGYDVNGFAGDY